MADRVIPGLIENENNCHCHQVNIHTMKITDACKDKDCIEDLRVYPTVGAQEIINTAFSIRPVSAELIHADVNVEPIGFNRGHYTVDVSYFYRVTGETFPGGIKVSGLAVFDKRVILCSSEGSVKIFSSCGAVNSCGGRPVAVVEAVDPIALNMRIVDSRCAETCEHEMRSISGHILSEFGEDLILTPQTKHLFVTLGQFSVIRLERNTMLTLDNACYYMPDKECVCSGDDDPCSIFSRVAFPTEEFYPSDKDCICNTYKDLI